MRLRRWLICWSVLVLPSPGAASLQGQAPPPQPAPPDRFAALRHVNIGGNGAVWVGFGTQLRERVESWTSFNFGAVPATPSPITASDVFALTRALVSADLHVGPHVRVLGQGISSFSTSRDLSGGRRPVDVDEVDVHQLYVEGRTATLAVRGGRMELAYGHERLVSALDWANTKRAFDGVTAEYSGRLGRVTTFWARPVLVRLFHADRRDSTTVLFGVYGTRRSTSGAAGADLYWIGQQRDSGVTTWNGSVGRERRHTVGLRLWGPAGTATGVDLEAEAALQFGRVGGNAIHAAMVAGQVGYTIRHVHGTPRLYVNVDYASGDASPGGSVGTFSQLNPQPHAFLGLADIVGRQNIVDVSGGGTLRVWRTLVAAADYHVLRRASAQDALYAISGAVARPASFGQSNRVASELDLSARWPIDGHALLVTGWSHVTPGAFIRQGGGASGADRPIDLVYLMTQYTL